MDTCRAQPAYYSVQGWQHQQCEKHLNKTDNDTRLKQASGSYDDYQQHCCQ